jgi:phage-related protein
MLIMEKPINVIFLKQAEEFIEDLDDRTRKKLFYAFRKTRERLFGIWFKKMAGSNDIFEFRIDEAGKFYRVFAFWDSEDDYETLIVCTHGLIKKTNKTPKAEIRKAEMIKRIYFEEKEK